MRLWSLHPKYLDPRGLVALWREALLAQAVLRGETRGYLRHPQLDRFRESATAFSAIGTYLAAIHAEASRRGYSFDPSRIRSAPGTALPIPVTSGQLEYEWAHLLSKLSVRDVTLHEKWRLLASPECHPLFEIRSGGVEPWERTHGPVSNVKEKSL